MACLRYQKTWLLQMCVWMLKVISLSANITEISFDFDVVIDCIIAISNQQFDTSSTLVLSLPNDSTSNVSGKTLLYNNIYVTRLQQSISYHFPERLYFSRQWATIVSKPSREVTKWDPLNWDPMNVEIHNGYVLIVTDQDDVRGQIEKLRSYPAWNARGKFLVALLMDTLSDNGKITDILQELWRWQILNAVVLSPLSNAPRLGKNISSVSVYTWFPYSYPSGECGKLKDVVLLDTWVMDKNGGRFFKNSPLFPNKVPDNLGRCSLRASTFEFEPFIICDSKLGTETNTSIVDGFEIFLMRCVAEAMNMTLVLRIPPGNDRGGVRLENGSWTGLRADLMHDKADIVFASLLSKLEDHLVFDDTIIYFSDRFTWSVPKANPYPRWLSTARVFSPATWLVGLLAILLSGIFMKVIFSFNVVKENEVSYTYWRLTICLSAIWAVLLGDSVPNMPSSLPLRTFFISLIIYSLAVNTVFQAFFTSYVVNPGLLHQIGDVDELIQSDLIYAIYYVMDKYLTEEFLQKLKPRIQCNPYTCLDFVASNDNYASFSGRALLAYIADELMTQDDKHEIYAFREDFFQLNSVMLMPKGSHLLNRVNQVLTRTVEAGLPTQWLKNVLDMRKIKAGVVALTNLRDEYIDLTMNHLQGAFFFLLIGLVLCFVVFLVEISTYYFPR